MPRIKILDAGFVTAINMYAPIVNPIIVGANTLGRILNEGHRVVEYNEEGRGVVLTLDNYRDPNRFTTPKEIEAKKAAEPVSNPTIPTTEIDTQAAVFTGYTKNTVMDLEPAKAPAAEATSIASTEEDATKPVATEEPKLTKAQRKALAKAKREEEAAKAAEATAEETVSE